MKNYFICLLSEILKMEGDAHGTLIAVQILTMRWKCERGGLIEMKDRKSSFF